MTTPPVSDETLGLMRAAFRTTTAGDGIYEMTFRFKSLEELHRADDEWRTLAREVLAMREEMERVRAAGLRLAEEAESRLCQHDYTHRGGVLWTICDECGEKWADDRGGFKPYQTPAYIAEARAALKASS